MFQISELVISGIELGVIILDYLFGFVMLFKMVKLEKGPSKTYYSGVTGFFFTHATCRLLFSLRSLFFPGNFYFFSFGTILGLLSIILLVAATEKTLYTKSKHFFTIYGLIGIGIMIVDIFIRHSFQIGESSYGLTMLTQYFFSPVLAAFIMVLYLRAALKVAGKVRMNAIFMLFAIILFALSEIAHSRVAIEILPVVEYLAPIMMAISLILLYYAISNLSVWKKGNKKEELARNEEESK